MRNQIEAIIFRKNNQEIEYLLLKRTQKKGGFWQPVTGGVEEKEREREAVIREVKEETGVEEILAIIEDVHYFKLEENGIDEFVFGVEVSPEAEISIEKNIYPEHDEFKWCNFEEALNLLKWPGNKEGLKKLNEKLVNNLF
jgi:8-oxo-dGTP pyrophosphatase MutT (NUDIX family)